MEHKFGFQKRIYTLTYYTFKTHICTYCYTYVQTHCRKLVWWVGGINIKEKIKTTIT